VTASVDLFDGLTASNIAVTEVVGAVMKAETRIAADGLAAAIHAACSLRSGAYQTVLVAAHGKASMNDYRSLTRWAMDPIHLQPLDVDFLVCAGLQASAMAAADGGAQRRWAELAARRRAAARGFALELSAEEVLASPLVAAPLREGMCAPLGDGAAAVVLSVLAPTPGRTSVRLVGMGHDLDRHAMGDRELARWDGLGRALSRARANAGLDSSNARIDLAEPSCLYPHEEELFRDACGIGGETAISPDGGLFGGTAPVVAGLSRLIAAARGLRGNAGLRRALAHGAWGPAGQGQAVVLLEGGH
jgi:acetyl-CoA acetyltransferase